MVAFCAALAWAVAERSPLSLLTSYRRAVGQGGLTSPLLRLPSPLLRLPPYRLYRLDQRLCGDAEVCPCFFQSF